MNNEKYWSTIDLEYFQPKSTKNLLKLLRKNIQFIKKQGSEIDDVEEQTHEQVQQQLELQELQAQQQQSLTQLINNIIINNYSSFKFPSGDQQQEIKINSFQKLSDWMNQQRVQQVINDGQNLQQNNRQAQVQQRDQELTNLNQNQTCKVCLQKLNGDNQFDVHPLCFTLESNRKEQSVQFKSPKKQCCYCQSKEGKMIYCPYKECQIRFHQRCQLEQHPLPNSLQINKEHHLCKRDQ